jgi:RNA polymerase subunit RPABC4/transcription elongation factor Spt4
MALWICTDCTARYSVGAPSCPQCGSTEYVEEGAQDMAKVTVHGGPSNAAADELEAGEGVSAGSSSSTSSETEPTSPETSEQQSPSRARTTGSRSKKAATD